MESASELVYVVDDDSRVREALTALLRAMRQMQANSLAALVGLANMLQPATSSTTTFDA